MRIKKKLKMSVALGVSALALLGTGPIAVAQSGQPGASLSPSTTRAMIRDLSLAYQFLRTADAGLSRIGLGGQGSTGQQSGSGTQRQSGYSAAGRSASSTGGTPLARAMYELRVAERQLAAVAPPASGPASPSGSGSSSATSERGDNATADDARQASGAATQDATGSPAQSSTGRSDGGASRSSTGKVASSSNGASARDEDSATAEASASAGATARDADAGTSENAKAQRADASDSGDASSSTGSDNGLTAASARRYEGTEIINSVGEEIGEVSSIVPAIGDAPPRVRVEFGGIFGGFLGLGEEDVLLDLARFSVNPASDQLVVDLTEEELERLEARRSSN